MNESDYGNNHRAVGVQLPPPATTPYGVGCAGTSGVPTLSASGLPVVGNQQLAVVVNGIPAPGLCELAIGASDRTWTGVSLRLSLAAFGAPNCSVLTSRDSMAPTLAGWTGTDSPAPSSLPARAATPLVSPDRTASGPILRATTKERARGRGF